MNSSFASLITRVAVVLATAIASCALACVLCAGSAFAADSYTLSLQPASKASSLHKGDTFTVNQVIDKPGAKTFPLYALSTTVTYDGSKLKLVSTSPEDSTGNVLAQDGSVTYNVFAHSMSGVILKSETAMCSMTFEVLSEEASNIDVTRTNMANYTGMHKMPTKAYGLTVTPGNTEPLQSAYSKEGSEKGDATDDDVEMATTEKVVEVVKQNPMMLLDENDQVDAAAVQGLKYAGMTNEEIENLGASSDLLEEVDEEEPAAAADEPAGNNAIANSTEDEQTAGKSFPVIPTCLFAIAIVLAAAVAFFAKRNRK